MKNYARGATSPFDEEVNGIIVGGYAVKYEFWTRDGKQRIAREYCNSDADAVAWFKENYPDWFATGVEMRVFDGR